MNHSSYPAPRTLVLVWLALMAATVMTMVAGKVTAVASIGLVWAGVLMAVTWFKARLILGWYLDLRSASRGWHSVFIVLITLIAITVLALYAAAAVAGQSLVGLEIIGSPGRQ